MQPEQPTLDYGSSAPGFRLTRRQVRTVFILLALVPLVLFVVFDLGFGGEHRSILWPWIDTVQAPGYSEEAFKTIRVGMTRQQVDALMCKPLHVLVADPRADPEFPNVMEIPAGASPDVGLATYTYTGDGRCPWGDFAWFARQVHFQDGVVTKVFATVYND